MTTALARRDDGARGVEVRDLTDLRTLGEMFARSGFFRDARDAAQACVKMQVGLELGIGPGQAMSGVHIVEGKPTLSSTLIASLIKRSGRYDYRVTRHDDDACVIVFSLLAGGQQIGTSSFTLADAERAGLLRNPTWQKFRRNMLFARAIANGARWHCPDVFGGAVYTPDEIGLDVEQDAPAFVAPKAAVSAAPAPAVVVALVDEQAPAPAPTPAAPAPLATVAELQKLALVEIERLGIGAALEPAAKKAARTALVKRICDGRAPRTAEDWQRVVDVLTAEPASAEDSVT